MFAIVQAAGWPIWPLIATSVLALALIIERFMVLRREKILPPKLLQEVVALYRNKQVTPDALTRLEASSPLGRILAAGLRNEAATREVMKDSIEEAGSAVAHELSRFIGAIGTISMIAPLMGLFGTVIGMIDIFGANSPTGGGANPTQLAHGISVALYNTGFGIFIAIPATIFYRYFRSKVDSLIIEMEQQAVKFIEIVHGVRQ